MAKKRKEYKELYHKWANDESLTSEENIAIARKLTDLNPKDPKAWDALATSIMGLLFPPEKLEFTEIEKEKIKENPLFFEMIEAWAKVLEISPDEPNVAWNRAISFDKVGLYYEAGREYLHTAKLIKKFPSEFNSDLGVTLFLAGKCFFAIGDYARAEEVLNQALKQGMNEDPEVWDLLGKILEARK